MHLPVGLLHCVKKQDMARMFVYVIETIYINVHLSVGLLHCVKKQDMARIFVNEMETIFKMCIFL